VGKTYEVLSGAGTAIWSGPGRRCNKIGTYPCGARVNVLEERTGWGRTDKGWVPLIYLDDVNSPPRVTDTGLYIQRDYIPAGRNNRPGGYNPDTFITIHETGNTAAGADAAAHAAWLKGDEAARKQISYHYTVDDHSIIQHLPDRETAYHAGDGTDGPGNTTSIGIELTVNKDGDFAQTQANAASLVRLLMKEHGIPIDHVVQHNYWSGKDCPYNIRHTSSGWEDFLALSRGDSIIPSVLNADVDTLARAGIITAPDYWKTGVYSPANVKTLIGKMAAYVRRSEGTP